jgi:hypothetical protein
LPLPDGSFGRRPGDALIDIQQLDWYLFYT